MAPPHGAATSPPVVSDLVTVHPLVIVGAGRAALAVVSRLPTHMLAGTTVLDTHGEWLHAWASRLKKCGAEHVRVPCTGTPLPQPLGLQAFATATKRTAELQRSSPRVVPVPSVQLYADYIAHACSAPGAATRAVTMRRGTVTALSALGDQERARLKLPAGGLRVTMADGSSFIAAQVVLACSFKTPAPVPECLTAANGPFSSGLDGPNACDVEATRLNKATVAILGGGTAAATLALAALHAGAAHVTLLARSHLRKREHDVDASWMGMAALRPFWQLSDPLLRLRALRQARPGGSVNAHQWTALRAALKAGFLRIEERVEVTEAVHDAHADTSQWTLHISSCASHADGDTSLPNVTADVLWCACGSCPDAARDPILASLNANAATHTRLLGGLPVLSDLAGGVRWPGVPLYVIGQYAGLAVGPAAGLHAGHRMAAEAICSALIKHAAAAAAGDRPYDVPAGALDLDDDDAETKAMQSPFCAQLTPTTPAKRDSSAIGVDLSDLPACLPRFNVEQYSWCDASSGDVADMRLTVRAPLPEAMGGVRPRCAFTARSADVWAVGTGAAYRLHLPSLFKEIVPQRCIARVVGAPDGVATLLLTLYKRESAPWRTLKAV